MRTAAIPVRPWIFVLALTALCAACSTPQVKPARSTSDVGNSGFLGDYDRLHADPEDPAFRWYVSSPGIVRNYHKFIIDAPEVLVSTGAGYQALDPARVTDMTRHYLASMAAGLGQHYQVVTQPGPGVARLRTAVVGVVRVNPELRLRDAIPVTALFKVAQAASGKNPQFLRMSVEAELIDAQSGKVLGAMVDSREGSRSVPRDESTSTGQLDELIDFWVARFVGRLDKANGFTQ